MKIQLLKSFIVDNDSLLLLLVSIGKYISKFDTLQLMNKKLLDIEQILLILDRDLNTISQEEIAKLSSLGVNLSDKLKETIIEKDKKISITFRKKGEVVRTQ
ncbi:hypothetical protein BJI55_13010 [Acinetobacter pittii]|nr:hypothetical protein BJI55_13010 [Acinetobacter pittii]